MSVCLVIDSPLLCRGGMGLVSVGWFEVEVDVCSSAVAGCLATSNISEGATMSAYIQHQQFRKTLYVYL